MRPDFTEIPQLSYAERQKLDTLRLRDTIVGEAVVKWSALPKDEVDKLIRKDGACMGSSIGTFYPETYKTAGDKKKIAAAKLVCSNCVLQPACLEYALETRQKNGIWGGATEKERKRMIKTPQRAAQRARQKAEQETAA